MLGVLKYANSSPSYLFATALIASACRPQPPPIGRSLPATLIVPAQPLPCHSAGSHQPTGSIAEVKFRFLTRRLPVVN
ncbi:MAG TPA: hypothetical protein PK502_00060 [Tenuifilaceae bacterium]|nr:hypothetical protein [Tenuifilaceae bacterium]